MVSDSGSNSMGPQFGGSAVTITVEEEHITCALNQRVSNGLCIDCAPGKFAPEGTDTGHGDTGIFCLRFFSCIDVANSILRGFPTILKMNVFSKTIVCHATRMSGRNVRGERADFEQPVRPVPARRGSRSRRPLERRGHLLRAADLQRK